MQAALAAFKQPLSQGLSELEAAQFSVQMVASVTNMTRPTA